jgi:signal transduction histidine kinase/ligand-binding sensor domain-containing protein
MCKRKTSSAFLLVIFLGMGMLMPCCAFAQLDHYRFSRIDANNGLSHNRIKTFFKDSRGFMWFGTVSGLNRYDGYTLRVFRNDPRDSTTIINDDINKMFEDHEGRIWIATWSGLDIYDPVTETFRHNPDKILKTLSIPEGNIQDIQRDRNGNYWFVHATQGLFRYTPKTQTTLHVTHQPNDPLSLSGSYLSQLGEDGNGNLWIIHRNGVFEKLDPVSLKVTYRNTALRDAMADQLLDYRFLIDRDNDLWFFIPDINKGIFYFNTQSLALQPVHQSSGTIRLNANIVRDIIQDNNGFIWVGTDHGGINLIDKQNNSVQYILYQPEYENSLSQNSINTLYKDNEGIIWVGTFKGGVNFYHKDNIRFPLYRHPASKTSSLPVNDINSLAEDHEGNVWIGTNGAGLIYFDRKKNTFKQYLHDPKDPNSLSNNVIVSLYVDHQKKLWIGTYYGGLNIFDGKRFTRWYHHPGDTTTIADDSIWEIYEDSRHRLWIGTLTRGVDVFDANRKKIRSYQTGKPNSIHANYIPAFLEDAEGNMWIGTGYGVDVIDKQTGAITHYLSETNNPSSLSNNSIMALHQDHRGWIWIGTHGGLNLFNADTKTFRAYKIQDGLPHHSILAIEEDEDHSLWLSTPNGLSHMVVVNNDIHNPVVQFYNYDESDGLQGRQFNESASLRLRSGEMAFGGANGFNLFHPKDIRLNERKPNVILTDLQVFNKSVSIRQPVNGSVLLQKSISLTDEIILRPGDNLFSLEFAALSYLHAEKNQYRYKLEGFHNDWLSTHPGQRSVTFTNLDPGSYTFRVIASNNDGIWNEEGAQLKITVLPPFWKTRTAFVLYVAVVLGALFVTRRLIQQRERMKFAIVQERQEAQRLHELDMMKIKFFTNVSHEFRTPLTLILTPIEKILKHTKDPEQVSQFQLIQRNAKRLLNLVNQLLDFRKLEVQEIRFNPSEGDMVSFIKETVYSFSDLSEKKDIRLEFHSSMQSLETIFDQDKLEKILFNLLSNAFKFTPEHGTVAVQLNCYQHPGEGYVEIVVKDTGIGIPADKLDKIFERFFQHDLPRSMVNQGSGIGLSITREFVRIHGGTIIVESEVGKWSTFTVRLPVKDVTVHHAVLASQAVQLPALPAEEPVFEGSGNGRLPTLLLVEDNEDFRFYLKDNLKQQYRIIEARDGQEGWDKVLKTLPDLVVTDVMMPELNGMELCLKIKKFFSRALRISSISVSCSRKISGNGLM